MVKTRDLVLYLERPARMTIGTSADILGEFDWQERHPDEPIVPDIIFEAWSRALAGVCYPLYKKSFQRWARSLSEPIDTGVVRYIEDPVPPFLRGCGDGEKAFDSRREQER